MIMIQNDSKIWKERSKWEIIFDLLKVLDEEKNQKKTRIMQRANLDWTNFQRYFKFLTEEQFIAENTQEKECYEITGKGKELHNRLIFLNDINKS